MATEVGPAAVSAPAVDSPYKGLANFTEKDASFFFGREREREVIIANLRARRVALLYGVSGVGKTSLLRAGVVPELVELAQESVEHVGTPEFIPVVFSVWRDDPVIGLIEAIETSVRGLVSETVRLPRVAGLAKAVEVAAEACDAYLLVILDQFEEYFLYHTDDTGSGTFADELPRAVAQPDLQASFLISIREDAVAKLDRFKARIPTLFDTFIRVEHLDPEAARSAILRPVEEYNARVAPERQVSVEPALVDAVLAQVRTGQVVLEQAGHGTVQRQGTSLAARDRIETPYLQLVMARLWSEELQRGSRSLHVQTLDALGGAQEIVRTHLDAALKNLSQIERHTVADLFHQLVTPSGTKIAHSAADLAEYVALSETQVTDLLEKLARPDTRIVRAVAPPPGDPGPPRYEIFHDVLAPSILDWRSRQAASRRARALFRRRVLRLLAVLGAAVIALIVWLGISAVNARNQADAAAARARGAQQHAEVVSIENTRLAGGYRAQSRNNALLAQRNAKLAATYNHQRLVESLLKRRADQNAAAAIASAARANQLATVNRAQAVRETVLAAAAQRSATAARGSATAAQLSLTLANEASALGSISPKIGVCADIAGNVGFPQIIVNRVPGGAAVTVDIPSGNRQTINNGGQTASIEFTKEESTCGLGGSGNASGQFGQTIVIFVKLADLAWLYEGQIAEIKISMAPSQAAFKFIQQTTCRTQGSRAPATYGPVCPPLPK